MDKKYIKSQCAVMIPKLEQQYFAACNGITLGGQQGTKKGTAVLRTRLKKSICTLYLIQELIEFPNAAEVTGEEANIALDKLLE